MLHLQKIAVEKKSLININTFILQWTHSNDSIFSDTNTWNVQKKLGRTFLIMVVKQIQDLRVLAQSI